MTNRILIATIFLLIALSTTFAETITVGTTYSDFWDYGCSGRHIARDTLGGLHMTWVKSLDSGANQAIQYDGRYPLQFPWEPLAYSWLCSNGSQVFWGYGSGYPTIQTLSNGSAVITGSHPSTTWGYVSTTGIDDGYITGAFIERYVTTIANPPLDSVIYPNAAVDHRDYLHVFSVEQISDSWYKRIYYSRSGVAATAPTFQMTTFQIAETTMTNTCLVVASRNTNRVIMAWPKPFDTNSPAEIDYNNNLCFVQTTNSNFTWNFSNPTNVTHFTESDSFRFDNDATAIFDNQNHLHIVYVIRGGFPVVSDSIPGTNASCLLMHWCETDPTVTDIVADGWWLPSDTHPALPYQSTIARPALSIATNGDLYCVFCRYARFDTSANGWGCGDIWATVSSDNGNNWYYPTNLTNTPANAGTAGNVHSEIFPSVQEVTNNDSLYISYLDDRAGGTAELATNSPEWTLNQVNVKIVRTNVVHRDSLLPTTSDWWYTSAYPPTPDGLTITHSNGNAYISWNPVENAVGYKIYRSDAGYFQPSSGNFVTTCPANVTSYIDGYANGHKYYRVVAYK